MKQSLHIYKEMNTKKCLMGFLKELLSFRGLRFNL